MTDLRLDLIRFLFLLAPLTVRTGIFSIISALFLLFLLSSRSGLRPLLLIFTLSAPGSESKWRTNCVSLQCSQICCLEFTSFFALKCKRIFEIFSIEPMLQQSNWCRKYKTFFFFQLAGVWLSYLYVDVTDLRFIGPFGWQNVILGVVNNGPDFRQNKTLSLPLSLSLGSLESGLFYRTHEWRITSQYNLDVKSQLNIFQKIKKALCLFPLLLEDKEGFSMLNK